MNRYLSRFLYCLGIAVASIAASSCTTENTIQETEKAIPRVAAPEKQSANTDALQWRFIGPVTGNRGSAVVGHPTDKNVFYFGASSGLWRTPDAGFTWEPLGDGQFKTGHVGAVEISQSNPDIIYVGMGEPQMRNNVSWGDGVYKSVDGGKNWVHLGLSETHHISQVRIHPTDPDIVYVGAFGHAFGPNKERGVYKTVDGGKNWKQVLFKSDKAGIIDLVINPSNPEQLFAAMWEFERKAWGPKTAGPDSGMWSSMDGGENWKDISRNEGLPQDGGYGRMGLTMSASDAKRVYALIDSESKAGLYRSDDLGENWAFVSDYFQITGRPFYYSHIYANPSNADELWSPNNRLFSSADAGETWVVEPGIKDDFHDIWIDKTDANRMIATNDGGVQVSLNGGLSWSHQYSQKVSQMYRVDTDNEFPYNVYGNSQDTVAFKVPSATRWGPVSGHYNVIVGNGETGSVIPDPNDGNIVYSLGNASAYGGSASFTVTNLKTGANEIRGLMPEPFYGQDAAELTYRYNWNAPFFVSKYDANTIFFAGNVVFKSTDRGMSWTAISEDLTNDHPEKQVITGSGWLPEYFGQEIYSTIHRMVESKVKRGIIWTGSDDGLIYVTRDEGKTWQNVSIPDLPTYSQIYEIDASPHDAATAYVVIKNYNTNDDYKPYIYKTSDFGQTWSNLSAAFPKGETPGTIREDINRKHLLYVGTETGVFASLDDGLSWRQVGENLPAVPVVDIKVREKDLVIATNGRGFWVLDDIAPIREDTKEVANQAAHLFSVYDYTRFVHQWWLDYAPGGDPGGMKKYFVQNQHPGQTYYELGVVNGEKKRLFVDAGDPEPWGALVYFKLNASVRDKEISISVLDADGNEIITHDKDSLVLAYTDAASDSFNSGLNRFVWNMRYPMVTAVPGRPPTAVMPIAKPGKYAIRLTVDGESQTKEFQLLVNPNDPVTKEQSDQKFVFWMDLYDNVEASTQKVLAALEVKADTLARVEALKKQGASNVAAIEQQAAAVVKIADDYEATYVPTGRTLAEIINLPAKIFTKMTHLSGTMENSEGVPTQRMVEVYTRLVKLSADTDARYDKDMKVALDAFKAVVE
jgi:photosystem II stability/assembly factor-like uncharacterized protein